MNAYSIGCRYGFRVDTRIDAEMAQTALDSRGYATTLDTIPSYNTMNTALQLSQKILFFSGHGSNRGMCFLDTVANTKFYIRYNNPVARANTVNLKQASILQNTNCIIFAGCKTADDGTNSVVYRLVHSPSDNAMVAIGWIKSVNSDSHTNWLRRFFNYIANSFQLANNLQNEPLLSEWNNAINEGNSYCYFPFSGVTSVHMETTLPTIANEDLKKMNSEKMNSEKMNSEKMNSEKMNNEIDKRIIFSSDEQNLPLSIEPKEIYNFMREHVKDFNEKEYEISIESPDTENATIILYHKFKDVYTNAGYNIIRSSGNIIALYNNDKSLVDSGICKLDITPEEIETEKKNAINAIKKAYEDCEVEIEEQISYFYYDLEKKLPLFHILTSYSVSENGELLFNDMHLKALYKK